jgi:hypothetical protein
MGSGRQWSETSSQFTLQVTPQFTTAAVAATAAAAAATVTNVCFQVSNMFIAVL